jgi:penicillin-binding protein 1A
MTVAHQGVEIREIAGIGAGQKAPVAANAAAGAAKVAETKPGPPPILTKRGADILVRVEKLLDDAGKTLGRTSAADPMKPVKPLSSSETIAFPDSFAAVAPDGAATPSPRKN